MINTDIPYVENPTSIRHAGQIMASLGAELDSPRWTSAIRDSVRVFGRKRTISGMTNGAVRRLPELLERNRVPEHLRAAVTELVRHQLEEAVREKAAGGPS